MIKIIEGNIVDAQTDYIIHQVNCQGEMNTGVAKALRDYDEGIYIHYRNVCKLRGFNPELLLGTYDEYFIRRKIKEYYPYLHKINTDMMGNNILMLKLFEKD